ncbi:MAG TPA: CvpA family protein, partial [Acidimicrobiales bacterium]|nr:CvpA family protein [Acidimicrobiales bacterium]
MNFLDLLILAALFSAIVAGYRLGFLARASSWVGLVLGLLIAVRELPAAIRLVDGATPATRLLVAAIVLVGGSLVGQALGLLAGSHIRSFVPFGPLHVVDQGAGAMAGALGVVAAVWLLLPAMADSSPSVSAEVRNSVVARYLDGHLPRPPDTLQALRRLVGANNFPSVFDSLRPAPVAGPPPLESGLPPAL